MQYVVSQLLRPHNPFVCRTGDRPVSQEIQYFANAAVRVPQNLKSHESLGIDLLRLTQNMYDLVITASLVRTDITHNHPQ